MTALILIRHGKTEANEKRIYCGSTDLPLSDGGIRELERLKANMLYPAVGGFRVLTSGMRRCEQTLEILYGSVTHTADERLREIDFGVFELHGYEELKDSPAYIEWITGNNEANMPPGGESGTAMKRRARSALRGLIEEGGDVLAVTHGGVIAAAMEALFPDEIKTRYEWQPAPGHGYKIVLDDGVAASYSPVPDKTDNGT